MALLWGGFIARRSTAHLQPLHQAGVFCTLGHPPCPSAAHFERIETARPAACSISSCRKCDGGAKGKVAAPLSEAERARECEKKIKCFNSPAIDRDGKKKSCGQEGDLYAPGSTTVRATN